ncbi:FUSC family protein [Myroides pelagicus]|nr:FUSC family protein [Myroides pelagicus]
MLITGVNTSIFVGLFVNYMLSKLVIRVITSPVIIYIIRCTIGLAIGYGLLIKYPDYQLIWTIISIMLVISPEGANSKKLSVERFKSNLVGSIAGLICLEIEPNLTFWICFLGILITILTCYLFKILNMARVALVALLIILIQPHTTDMGIEITPIIRTLSVTVGCLIGLLITVLTSPIIRGLKRHYGIPLKQL